MSNRTPILWLTRLALGLVLLDVSAWRLAAQATTDSPKAVTVVLVELEGSVDVMRAGATVWDRAYTNQNLFAGDRLRTGENSRALLRLTPLSALRISERSQVVIQSPTDAQASILLTVWQGIVHFFHRDRPGQIQINTRTASGAVRGTEFDLAVDETGRTVLSLFDGEVLLSNDFGQVDLISGEQGIAEPNRAPTRTALLNAINVIQWALYYPGVLDLNDLALNAEATQALDASLGKYRAGDLLGALANYPESRQPTSDAERVYHAALLLAVGQVARTEEELAALPISTQYDPLAASLRTLIAAVKHDPRPVTRDPQLATELLAASYYEQSRSTAEIPLGDKPLKAARDLARRATSVSAQFGFAWERVAELEFGFGRTDRAADALDKSLELSPRNAQALALKGFVLAARNKITEATKSFEMAIAADPALGNAWLGRGLCRIRRGDVIGGQDDLLIAAALEPQRALLRSYLGKAWSETKKDALAAKELDLAKQLDPADPTPWLYSALIKQEQNRINEAVADLHISQVLNQNRVLFRSQMLLDQDQAIRSTSLASIFRDAGMLDRSLQEAARAVNLDYANYSAHLFLANSYDALRDPTRFNLRYETPWFNELLLANLQAPPGAPTISANISQQEYARLFERDRLGLTTTTELRSDGQYREIASQFGAWGPFSYSLDLDWQHNDGVRPNNDLGRTEWYSQLKYQLSPEDSILALIKYQDYDAGDNFQYYDPSSARPAFRISSMQTPLLLAGWHHEWSPGIHTLVLGGRLVNEQRLSDLAVTQTVAVVNPVGVIPPRGVPFDVNYHSQFEIYSAEWNQIFQRERHTDILGLRYQDGTIQADNVFANPPASVATNFTLPSLSATDSDFRRLSLYAYHYWQIFDGFQLVGGLAYDDLQYPANFRRPPLSTDASNRSEVSPKAALLWDITPKLRARAVYAQSVGGVSYDESVRLEPTQLAGFSQAFRSLISESLVGSVEAPRYDIAGGAIDLRPWTNAWLSLQGEGVRERVDREFGIFNYNFGTLPPATPGSTAEQLDYHEYNARLIFNQSFGREWTLEAQYQFTRSELERTLPDIAAPKGYSRTMRQDADLHQFGLAANWRHPSGFFVRGEFWEVIQRLGGSAEQPPGDEFPLLNLYVGYRLPHRRGELTVGVMNLLNEDYHFSPVNYHPEYPRSRVFYTRFTFNF